MNRKQIQAAIAIALGCAIFSSTASAATPPPKVSNDAGIQINRMRQYLERERVKRQIAEDRAKVKNEVETGEKATMEGTVSFELKKIVTEPSAVLTGAELAAIVKPYEGKLVQLEDIYAVVAAINALYADKGYVTCRAFLPPQTITDGTVKLLLVEGRTGSTMVSGNKYTRSSYITDRLHLTDGEIANIKELNGDLLLFNATNSTQLRIVMKAGAQPGTTDYEIIAYEPRQYSWTLMADNAGSYTSGECRAGLFFNIKSLSGVCDNFSLSTVLSEGSTAANAMYSRGLGRRGTRFNLLYSTNKVDVVKGVWADVIDADSSAYTLGIVHPLKVNEKQRTELSLDYNVQESESDLHIGAANFNIVDDTVKDFTLGFAQTDYGSSHVLYRKYSYTHGSSDSTPGMSPDVSQDFNFFKLNALYQKVYPKGQMLNVRADAQWSSTKGMVSSRQFYMGGMYSVRGYKENYLGGDSGYVVSTEYQVPVLNRDTSAFTFFDYGRVCSNGQSADVDNALASIGLGLRTVFNQRYTAVLTLGLPLKRNFQDETVSSARLHFLVSSQL